MYSSEKYTIEVMSYISSIHVCDNIRTHVYVRSTENCTLLSV